MDMYKRKVVISLLILLFFFIVLFHHNSKTNEVYIPTIYEKELIDYFKEIALQSEYDYNPQKIIKWREPMILYVKKEKEFKPQMSFIKKTIDEINRLATDGFKIVLTNELSKSNAILYLCTKEKVADLDKQFYKLLTDDIDYNFTGLAYSEFETRTHIIDKALIFVDTGYDLGIQKVTILEEITQSLGLAFDSKSYKNSVFYIDKSEESYKTKEYSTIDRDIIRLLYHPKMKPGFDSTEIDIVIKRILKSEKK
jgi:hypothetical protein